MQISDTEENYIKAIFALQMQEQGEVSTNRLSGHLLNRAASVTDMLKRLSEKKLIHYEKYKGVSLSAKGYRLAVNIVRKHRLWEVFLKEKLHFKWDEVHDIAEQLEHVQSEELVSRLDKYLGYPKFDPHGDPIPDKDGLMQKNQAVALARVDRKGNYRIARVTDHSRPFLNYITELGLKIGDVVRVEEVNAYDASCKLKTVDGQTIFLSQKAGTNILVEQRR